MLLQILILSSIFHVVFPANQLTQRNPKLTWIYVRHPHSEWNQIKQDGGRNTQRDVGLSETGLLQLWDLIENADLIFKELEDTSIIDFGASNLKRTQYTALLLHDKFKRKTKKFEGDSGISVTVRMFAALQETTLGTDAFSKFDTNWLTEDPKNPYDLTVTERKKYHKYLMDGIQHLQNSAHQPKLRGKTCFFLWIG